MRETSPEMASSNKYSLPWKFLLCEKQLMLKIVQSSQKEFLTSLAIEKISGSVVPFLYLIGKPPDSRTVLVPVDV